MGMIDSYPNLSVALKGCDPRIVEEMIKLQAVVLQMSKVIDQLKSDVALLQSTPRPR